MISIKHVYKTYDGGAEALSDINLEIADGDVFGIIGMSGAGKSTLVRTINLLERPRRASSRSMAVTSPRFLARSFARIAVAWR